ncbi:methyltransferase-like protein 25B [Oscarella lobularis]|uniref:methyltransferase-like protein 25B n=1 Tax=Oscarella lobularis TaxID=121494 RepID=UPI003313D558
MRRNNAIKIVVELIRDFVRSMGSSSLEPYASLLTQVVRFLDEYDWLVNSLSIHFFTDDLWSKLPTSWQAALQNVSTEQLAEMLSPRGHPKRRSTPWPLSLEAFVATCHALALPRQPAAKEAASLSHSFSRFVKGKKRHELERLVPVIDRVCSLNDISCVVDVGCGQGHLARLLAYGYGMSVDAVEAEESHLGGAEKGERMLMTDWEKQEQRAESLTSSKQSFRKGSLAHTRLRVSPDLKSDDFLERLSWKEKRHAIVGLHTCGNLGPTIFRLFAQCSSSRALVSMGCCYMKSFDCESTLGYPLSQYVKDLSHQLSFRAAELACHTMDAYRLRLQGCNEGKLNVHAYRAAVELLVCKKFPSVDRSSVRKVRNYANMSVVEYAKAAISKMGLPLDLTLNDVELLESTCPRHHLATAFFCIRLLLGPVIETCLLLDRVLYLREHGVLHSYIWPLFDPRLSPRNMAIIAWKKQFKVS